MIKRIALASALICSSLTVAQAASITATVGGAGAAPADVAVINVGYSYVPTGAAATGGTGDLVGVGLFSALTINPFTATDGTNFGFSAPWGSFSGVISGANRTGPDSNATVGFYALGTFTPGGAPLAPGFDPGAMSVTLSTTQTGVLTGQPRTINIAFTAASPPVPPTSVPEPGALALVGLAMAGLALTRRKTAKA